MLQNEPLLQYLQDDIFRWYQQADTKAQVILGFTGVILSVLVGAFVSGSVEPRLAWSTWFPLQLFWVAVVCHLGAVIFSAVALWSRGVFKVTGESVVFFGAMANYRNAKDFREAILTELTQEGYQDELTRNLHEFARNTRTKHRFVDAAVISSGLALFTTVWLLVGVLLQTP